MLSLLPYPVKRFSKLCIFLGILFSLLSGFIAGLSSPWYDQEIGVGIDYGQGLFAIGIILYLFSKDKINDEFVNYLKLQAGAVVIVVTIIYSVIEKYLVDTNMSLSYLVSFQFILYYIIYKWMISNQAQTNLANV